MRQITRRTPRRNTRRSTRLRLAAITGAFAAAFAAGTVQAPVAAADPSICRAVWFCVWSDANQEGAYLMSKGNVSYVGTDFNDKASSYWNRTSWYVNFYYDANYGGGCMLSIPPGGSSTLLPGNLNDRMSSYIINPTPAC
ncbi:peptidase inhibitor family I36 protein [Streptomyces clavuligerus]|uniref:Inhibitor_I36 domain-containing protein n=1 Tax=Streptomyces clavuligerus TaxID=1901 RepID=B5GLW4_STRCL|nr:peptidase inhibitor family I36 protein [Streptomyces clavuligerus]EDY47310.1 hypothetical protein SSCG_00338 [Streptomyces clavuligerus]EFG04972.1 Inhibitor_I36 domain-containing protein [Streptomyces clavuligerus]MBY6306602.1 peptidase inhibitor family I36 protein [Streptomyces clavuligerus]QCS10792.1 hypothetical protein CRV15_35350 [Streptomyces clavuligerus]QPJ97173.1 hypothetical protein GE265_29135 [Streptomyces clavuligerus]